MIQLLVSAILFVFPLFIRDGNLPETPSPDQNLCWDYDLVEPPSETFEQFIASVGQSRGVYTDFAPEGTDIRYLGNTTYGVEAGQSIELRLQLFTQEAEPQSIRYVLFHNESQLTLPVNGQLQSTIDAHLVPNEIQTYVLTLPELKEGIHDLVLIGIQGFDQPPQATGTTSVFSFRRTLIAGHEAGLSYEDNEIKYALLEAEEKMQNSGNSILLGLTLSADTLVQWSYPEPKATFTADDPISINVLAGYSAAFFDASTGLQPLPSSRFALIALLDYQQVPLNSGNDVFYGEVLENTHFARVPITLDNPNQAGEHDLVMVRINYPRVPLCVLSGPPDGYTLNSQAIHNRVRFEIIDSP